MLKAVKKLLPVSAAVLVLTVSILSYLNDKKYSQTSSFGFACGSDIKVTAFGIKNEDNLQKSIDEMSRLDSCILSDTIPASYTYKLNESGKITDEDGEFVSYINECMGLVGHCEQMTLLSKPFITAWDIGGNGRIPTESEIAETVKKADMKNLSVNGNEVSLKNGAKLSFGAFGKGTVCEAGLNILKKDGASGGIVTVGGTVGIFGEPKRKELYEIGIRDPFLSSNDYFATLSVTDCFISTSGDYEKYFEQDGKRYCHIFNAETGLPVQSDITSVTVISGSGTKSDFLSTAVFILGEDGFSLADEMNAEVIMVKKDKNVIVSESLKENFELKKSNNEFTVSYR